MNYWIFVHTGEHASETFEHLVNSKNWGFETKPQIRKKVESLRKGDKVLFYVGGANGGYLKGETVLTSDAHSPSRLSIGGPRDMNLDAMVDFDNVDLWSDKKLNVKDHSVREKLDFIKNKDNWGMSLGQSLVKICESDYNQIKSLL